MVRNTVKPGRTRKVAVTAKERHLSIRESQER